MQLFLLLVIIAVTAAQQDPILDFCRRHQHQTCVIDNTLYIDGGKVHYGGLVENGSIALQNPRLLWENVLATDKETEFPQQFKNLSKGSEVPSVSGGVLWPDIVNKLFYLFGGEYNDVSQVQPFTSLWFYDVVYNTWNRTTSSAAQAGILWPAFGSGTVTERGTAYYYGGYVGNKTIPKWSGNPLMLSSLISFDMNTQTWSNHTYDSIARAEGILQYLPASASGILLYFGGVETDSEGRVRYANMSVIRWFDINENKWFTQIASGYVPSPRRGMCAGLAWAPDRSSFNVYVQGGIGEDGAAFGETYILTLPSFQWTLIYPEPSRIPNTENGKGWLSCNVVRGMSQMIVLGGYYTNTSYVECDVPMYNGQHGLLLGQESEEVKRPQVQWWWRLTPEYNSYRVPDKIVSLVGGNASGYATRTAPVQGWETPEVSGYFQGIMSTTSRTATRIVPPTSPATNLSTSNDPGIGTIVGATVGSVIALACLIAIGFYWLQHTRRQQTRCDAPGLDNNDQTAELDGPSLCEKPASNPNVLQGGTVPSSTTSTPFEASPPPLPASWRPESACAELPDSNSPASAELSDVRSPINSGLPDLMSPGSRHDDD